mmetsp:Transcript_26630/g.30465  ORF Transcript_26630/g.30465 Transcript_26630/m.30465 type:complete len:820 (+) Transcript_26630:102-2561(+)
MGRKKTGIESRKALRKRKRDSKKKNRQPTSSIFEEEGKNEVHQTKKSKKNDVNLDSTPSSNNNKDKKSSKIISKSEGPYSNLDLEVAAELTKEDAEIADLEAKLGLGSKKEKNRLHKEYAKLEGYGEDFGNFLDDLDAIVGRVASDNNNNNMDGEPCTDNEEEDNSETEEIVPMKGPQVDFGSSSSSSSSNRSSEWINSDDESSKEGNSKDKESSDGESETSTSIQQDEDLKEEKDSDHCFSESYQPEDGEDIYGRQIDSFPKESDSKRYIPPHLRKTDNTEDRKEKLQILQRSLNNILNRLSKDTMISVAQSLAQIYENYPTSDVNEYMWKNISSAVIDTPVLMEPIIPVYVASLTGVHLQTGDTVQLGGYLIEQIITKLWKIRKDDKNSEEQEGNKEASNLVLCMCYLYNFGLIHSVFMFDIVRSFIDSLSELDIELLLLVLSHSGYSLRSDDPLALKEIVLAVEKKQDTRSQIPMSSRTEFMLACMTDLKNNKRRKKDTVFSERTVKLRKFLGQIKSDTFRSSDSTCLRIRLHDILTVETKGRWWKVGASWIGNQFKHVSDDERNSKESINPKASQNEDELLKLATKCRMNTDSRRSIFCIIMGSTDCDDAFEKLVRAGMLKNRCERDCVRVLMECCSSEKNHNPFYSFLASRLCDYQPQCKFSFQLAFWDFFKQWDNTTHRKSANLAKLLYHLVAVHQSLKMSMLKTIDMSNLEETATIFLTILFSSLFELTDDQDKVRQLIKHGISRSQGSEGEEDRLRENLSVFFLQTLKSSPKNKKKSLFRSNLKVAIKVCETSNLEDTMLVNKQQDLENLA